MPIIVARGLVEWGHRREWQHPPPHPKELWRCERRMAAALAKAETKATKKSEHSPCPVVICPICGQDPGPRWECEVCGSV